MLLNDHQIEASLLLNLGSEDEETLSERCCVFLTDPEHFIQPHNLLSKFNILVAV